jgi:hypothetical protein
MTVKISIGIARESAAARSLTRCRITKGAYYREFIDWRLCDSRSALAHCPPRRHEN